ncbi:hypothetical protein V5O48_018940, partial [Marasmius crinis-equi]
FNVIIEHLVKLSTFWKAIEEECTAVLQYIQTALDKDTTPRVIKNSLGQKLGGSIYLALGYVLDIYVKQLSDRDWRQIR